jgi:hypothetical protein
MVTYARLRQHPSAAPSLIGMSLKAFEALWADFEPAHEARLRQQLTTKRGGQPRQRAPGGGRRFRYDLRDRLLLTLFWLKAYTTYEVLGFFYDLDKTRIEDILHDILATLAALPTFELERPSSARRKLASPAEVMTAYPAVRWVVDSQEQRIQRPKNPRGPDGQPLDRQRPYYSGKKKQHTLKTQIAVAPDGQIAGLWPSVPGATSDVTLFRASGLLACLAPDETVMVDCGFDGIRHDFAAHPTALVEPHHGRRGHPLTDAQRAENRELARYRIVVEHTLAQLSRFSILRQVFRHALGLHARVFRAVAGLVARRIQARPLKRYAAA